MKIDVISSKYIHYADYSSIIEASKARIRKEENMNETHKAVWPLWAPLLKESFVFNIYVPVLVSPGNRSHFLTRCGHISTKLQPTLHCRQATKLGDKL